MVAWLALATLLYIYIYWLKIQGKAFSRGGLLEVQGVSQILSYGQLSAGLDYERCCKLFRVVYQSRCVQIESVWVNSAEKKRHNCRGFGISSWCSQHARGLKGGAPQHAGLKRGAAPGMQGCFVLDVMWETANQQTWLSGHHVIIADDEEKVMLQEKVDFYTFDWIRNDKNINSYTNT